MPNNYPSRKTISDGTTLLPSPVLKRAEQLLQDLIIQGYERSTNRPGNSLTLSKLQYAYDENNEEKSCTHFDILVKDLDLNEHTILTLTIAVNKPTSENWT